MRWIPPGRFMMGSPDDEEGRYDNEGPVHEVTLLSGFWLFDTPCTQALYEAVMGKKAKRNQFHGQNQPVETVSFDDAGRFIDRLNGLIAGLDLSLPSEAQWESSTIDARRARAGYRVYFGPWYRDEDLGFRCARLQP